MNAIFNNCFLLSLLLIIIFSVVILNTNAKLLSSSESGQKSEVKTVVELEEESEDDDDEYEDISGEELILEIIINLLVESVKQMEIFCKPFSNFEMPPLPGDEEDQEDDDEPHETTKKIRIIHKKYTISYGLSTEIAEHLLKRLLQCSHLTFPMQMFEQATCKYDMWAIFSKCVRPSVDSDVCWYDIYLEHMIYSRKLFKSICDTIDSKNYKNLISKPSQICFMSTKNKFLNCLSKLSERRMNHTGYGDLFGYEEKRSFVFSNYKREICIQRNEVEKCVQVFKDCKEKVLINAAESIMYEVKKGFECSSFLIDTENGEFPIPENVSIKPLNSALPASAVVNGQLLSALIILLTLRSS